MGSARVQVVEVLFHLSTELFRSDLSRHHGLYARAQIQLTEFFILACGRTVQAVLRIFNERLQHGVLSIFAFREVLGKGEHTADDAVFLVVSFVVEELQELPCVCSAR